MKPILLILSIFTLPLHAEIRAAVRAGGFAGPQRYAVGTFELDARAGNWSLSPAFELIRGGHDLHAIHANVRRLFPTGNGALWLGAGPTFIRSNVPASETTWNADAGWERRTKSGWSPFVAARYYRFRLPIFRDEITGGGAVISIGISRGLLH